MTARGGLSVSSAFLCGVVAVMSLGLFANAQAQTSSSVVGRDLSGKYTFQRLECYSRSTGQLDQIGTISNFNETIEISGNSFTETAKGGSCTFVVSGSIVFTEAGTFSTPDSKASVPGGSCTASAEVTILSTNGTQSAPVQITYNDGQTIPAQSGQYRVDSTNGNVSVEFTSPVSYPTGDRCFEVYSPS
jgi:hypothetical protein